MSKAEGKAKLAGVGQASPAKTTRRDGREKPGHDE